MSTYKGLSKVQLRKPERSKFDLSHEKKLSGRMGKLYPVFVSETLPNDTFRVNTEVMLRFAPLLAPIYHRVNVFVHFFFVPTRILYKDWEKMITNGRLGTETPPVSPYAPIADFLAAGEDLLDKGSLADYLGIRPIPDTEETNYTLGQKLSLLPFAAYYKIWYDYYRDRNYVADDAEGTMLPFASGEWTDDLEKLCRLRTRCWEHDYFTSALPWTQRGDDVLIPMEAAVEYYAQSKLYKSLDNSPAGDEPANRLTSSISNNVGYNVDPGMTLGAAGNAGNAVRVENIESIANGSVTINDLRQAIRLQEWFERNAVAGSRYNESIMAHFARRTSDGRLQRAEYLGGGRVPVSISEVLTTAFSEDGAANTVPPASMTGRGASYLTQAGFKYNCEEHGFIMGLMSVMPRTGYMDGISRMFVSRETFLDYPWPSFAHLGEQPVYEYEVWADPSTLPPTGEEPSIWGYQSRYADWKYIQSTAHGDFRDTLDFWHLDRKFAAEPGLGEEFVTFEDALQDRIFAVAGVDTLWCYLHNKVSVVRSLPYFGTPRI